MEIKLSNGVAEIDEKFEWLWGSETKYLEALHAKDRATVSSLIAAENCLIFATVKKITINGKDAGVDVDGLNKLFPKDREKIMIVCNEIRNAAVLHPVEKKS